MESFDPIPNQCVWARIESRNCCVPTHGFACGFALQGSVHNDEWYWWCTIWSCGRVWSCKNGWGCGGSFDGLKQISSQTDFHTCLHDFQFKPRQTYTRVCAGFILSSFSAFGVSGKSVCVVWCQAGKIQVLQLIKDQSPWAKNRGRGRIWGALLWTNYVRLYRGETCYLLCLHNNKDEIIVQTCPSKWCRPFLQWKRSKSGWATTSFHCPEEQSGCQPPSAWSMLQVPSGHCCPRCKNNREAGFVVTCHKPSFNIQNQTNEETFFAQSLPFVAVKLIFLPSKTNKEAVGSIGARLATRNAMNALFYPLIADPTR